MSTFTYPVSIEAVYGSGTTTNVTTYKVVKYGGYIPHEIFRGTYEQCDRFVKNYMLNYTQTKKP